jgi:hypothetical protein
VVHIAHRVTTRRVLAAAGVGGVLAAGITGTVLSSSASPAAAASGSIAFGVQASGNDHQSANSGAVTGGSFSAEGISTQTGPGFAKASVASLTVDHTKIGSVSAACEQGVSKVTHSGATQNTPFFHVTFGKDGGRSTVGVTVTITDRKGTVSQTVRAAGVTCDKEEEGTTPPPTSAPHTGNPTGHPTSAPGHHPSTKVRTPGGKTSDRDATPIAPRSGHQAVTG